MQTVRRDPRINSLRIKQAKGGFFDFQPRNSIKPIRVDTVPAHAQKTDNDILQRNGVCLPIQNTRKNRGAK